MWGVATELGPPDAGILGDHRVAFVSCSELDPTTFERFYHQVLEPAFRPDELVELAEMSSALLAGDGSEFGTVVLRDGEPVAGMLGEVWDSGVVLLGYVAVRPDVR